MNNLIDILDETITYRSSTRLIYFRSQVNHQQHSRGELPPFLGATILHGGISSRFAWKQPSACVEMISTGVPPEVDVNVERGGSSGHI